MNYTASINPPIRVFFTRFILLIFSLTILSSCSVKDVEVGNIQSFNVLEINKEYIEIDITAPVKNENNFSFRISDVDLNVTFNGIDLGKINKIKPIRILKKSESIQHLVFKIRLEQVAKGGLLFISSLLANKAKLKVKGYVKTSKFIFSKRIKVDYNQTTPIFSNR